MMAENHFIDTILELESLFDHVGEVSIKKEVSYLHPSYQAMISASPFVVLATVRPDGLDVSPRGDPPGFVHIKDEHTLWLPECVEIIASIACETSSQIHAWHYSS